MMLNPSKAKCMIVSRSRALLLVYTDFLGLIELTEFDELEILRIERRLRWLASRKASGLFGDPVLSLNCFRPVDTGVSLSGFQFCRGVSFKSDRCACPDVGALDQRLVCAILFTMFVCSLCSFLHHKTKISFSQKKLWWSSAAEQSSFSVVLLVAILYFSLMEVMRHSRPL